MPLRVVYTFDCDKCGHSYGGLIESQGYRPEPPPDWVCDWGAYLCPTCKVESPGCVMCGDPVMERDALVCAAHDPGR